MWLLNAILTGKDCKFRYIIKFSVIYYYSINKNRKKKKRRVKRKTKRDTNKQNTSVTWITDVLNYYSAYCINIAQKTETVGLVTFTEEFLNGKLHFLCSENAKFEDQDLLFIVSQYHCTPYRGSRPQELCKKRVLKNFAKFTGEHRCQILFYNTVEGWVV